MRKDIEIRSCVDMVDLVNEWGFLPLFKNDVKGFSVEEHTPKELWFADDAEGPWEWKGPTIRESGCAYGKFFRNKAVFISYEWYKDFCNYRRDGYDYDARYDDGLAVYRDKTVYDILEQYPSLLSKDLKSLWEQSFPKKGFDVSISRLQMLGYVTTVDFEYMRDKTGKVYGWGVAKYATPEAHFGEDFKSTVYKRSPEESKQRILEHLSSIFPEADEKDILKLIG